MYNKCSVRKSCTICLKEKHNLEFQSNRKGRTEVKPYCKSCKPIYDGVKQNLLEFELYKGKNYDVGTLIGEDTGHIIQLFSHKFERISKDKAIQFVKQGGAYITSPSTIEVFNDSVGSSKSIATDLRQAVLRRDNKKCHYCGDLGGTMDHVIPRSKGGLNTMLNLVVACGPCNTLKANMSKEEFLKKRQIGEISDERLLGLREKWKKTIASNSKHQKRVNISISTPSADGLRTCASCGASKSVYKFEAKSSHCRKCDKFTDALQRKWITSKKLTLISTDSQSIKGENIVLMNKDGGTINIPSSKAKMYARRGIVEVMDSKTVKFLFTPNQMKILFPGIEFPTKTAFNNKLLGSNIGVYFEKLCLGSLKKKDAVALITLQKAELKEKDNQISVYSEFRNEVVDLIGKKGQPNSLLSKDDLTSDQSNRTVNRMLKGPNIAVFIDNAYFGTTDRNRARELVIDQKAKIDKKNRIILDGNYKDSLRTIESEVVSQQIKMVLEDGTYIGTVDKSKKPTLDKLVSLGVAVFNEDEVVTLKYTPLKIKMEYPMLKLSDVFHHKKIPKIKNHA